MGVGGGWICWGCWVLGLGGVSVSFSFGVEVDGWRGIRWVGAGISCMRKRRKERYPYLGKEHQKKSPQQASVCLGEKSEPLVRVFRWKMLNLNLGWAFVGE